MRRVTHLERHVTHLDINTSPTRKIVISSANISLPSFPPLAFLCPTPLPVCPASLSGSTSPLCGLIRWHEGSFLPLLRLQQQVGDSLSPASGLVLFCGKNLTKMLASTCRGFNNKSLIAFSTASGLVLFSGKNLTEMLADLDHLLQQTRVDITVTGRLAMF